MEKEKRKKNDRELAIEAIAARAQEMQGIRMGHFTLFQGKKIESRKLFWREQDV